MNIVPNLFINAILAYIGLWIAEKISGRQLETEGQAIFVVALMIIYTVMDYYHAKNKS